MKKVTLTLVAALAPVAVIASDALPSYIVEEPGDDVKSVEWYRVNHEERKAMLEQCEEINTWDCHNADEADFKNRAAGVPGERGSNLRLTRD